MSPKFDYSENNQLESLRASIKFLKKETDRDDISSDKKELYSILAESSQNLLLSHQALEEVRDYLQRVARRDGGERMNPSNNIAQNSHQ